MFALAAALLSSCGIAPAAVSPAPAEVPTPVAAVEQPGLTTPTDLSALFAEGRTLTDFVAAAERRQNVWRENVARARIPADVAARADALRGRWRLLVVAADGCLDSAFSLPPMDRLAFYSDALELRVVAPDAGGQEIMEARRTPDGRAATPTVVILDESGAEAGCWIERPVHQRDFHQSRLKGVEQGSESYATAVAEFLDWYRDDNGATALRELMDLLEAAEAGARGCGLGG